MQRALHFGSKASKLVCSFCRIGEKHGLRITTAALSDKSFKSKVPQKPTWSYPDEKDLIKPPEIDLALLEQLERISLVEFNNEQGLINLKESVKLASQLQAVDTEGVEPMDSILEDRKCYLRSDEVTDGNCVEDVMANASKTEEQYFVAPPGNIPLKARSKDHLSNVLNKDKNSDEDDRS